MQKQPAGSTKKSTVGTIRKAGYIAVCVFFISIQAAAGAQPAPKAPAPAEESAPAGNVPAVVQQQLQPDAAFALMAGEAEKGNTDAMLTLGRFYEQGVGAPRNYTKALEWYKKAAEAGRSQGHYNVAVCYEIGMGAARDMGKAIQSYQKAAELGLPLAMYKLSSIYISGDGASKDTAKAVAYLEQAAKAGMPVAANELGMVYLSGLLGQKKDEKKALEMFTKAAEAGSLDAIQNIAAIYKDGIGAKADPVKAYTWYLIARRGGYGGEDIARILGLLEGTLTEAQTQQAHKDADDWIEKISQQSSGKGQ